MKGDAIFDKGRLEFRTALGKLEHNIDIRRVFDRQGVYELLVGFTDGTVGVVVFPRLISTLFYLFGNDSAYQKVKLLKRNPLRFRRRGDPGIDSGAFVTVIDRVTREESDKTNQYGCKKPLRNPDGLRTLLPQRFSVYVGVHAIFRIA
jgi:hypothetical protein